MMFKNCMPLALIVVLLTSCSSLNDIYESHSLAYKIESSSMHRTTFTANTEENALLKQLAKSTNSAVSGPKGIATNSNSLPSKLSNLSTIALESLMPMQFKYAIMMNATVEKITNVSLYRVIDEWFGTRYRFGGTTRKGIDCSAFMQVIGQYVFGWAFPRTANAQYAIMEKVAREDIKEGDFVYFHTTRRGVSHVGMCLQNNKFVHASTSKGVIISDLDDSYWDNRIIGFKRMKEDQLTLTD